MSLVNSNDGYADIFGAPKPAPKWEQPLNKFVDSKYFPMVAGALVGAGAGAAFGAGSAAATAIKVAPTLIGAATADTPHSLFPGHNAMTDPNPISFTGATNPDQSTNNTQLTGNIPQAGTAQVPGQPVIVMPQNNTVMYLALAGVFYLLMKRK